MTHRYVQRSGAKTATFTDAFSCNGIFAPASGGGGHQPLYFDQLITIYNHYTVIASKIKVWFVNADTTGNIVWWPSLALDDNATPSATSTTVQEEGRTVNSAISNSTGFRILRKSWKAKASFGGDPLGDPNLQGTVSGNPSEEEFYILQGVLSGTAVNGLYYQLEIEYDTVWQELRTITGS